MRPVALATLLVTLLTGETMALTADLPTGSIRGMWADREAGIRAFLGVPYARPPVGPLRFRPPVPLPPWQGVRDATRPGKACRQHPAPEAFVWSRGPFEQSEDCLFLNVWTGTGTAGKRPVMVWVHGGSHRTGFGHARIFDGTELARRGVVLVTLNYRLGALGFLSHPALSAESPHQSSGNYGLLDVIAALAWVKANIAALGGDPGNITLFGQSAGSQTVCLLMTSPLAAGLFHKAIGQSGSCALPVVDKDANGQERGVRLAKAALGTAADDPAMIARALREVPADRLLAAEIDTAWDTQSRTVIDGWVVPEPARDRLLRGDQAKIPLLVGSTADEGNGLFPLNTTLTLEELRSRLARRFGGVAEPLLERYAPELSVSPGHAERAINADQYFATGMREWAELHGRSGAPVYLYHMAHVPPAFRLYDPDRPALDLPGGPRSAGAYHSGDLAYVFANTRKVGLHWTADDHSLAAMMADCWTRFARTGDPAGDPSHGITWPRYDAVQRQTLVFDKGAHVAPGVRTARIEMIRAGTGL
jgi:para-nitrobenzyl esterase